jgi:dTDP-glucose 4,6-dehydratase
MRVLVTGAAGFVGYHMVMRLFEDPDIEVVTLDNHYPLSEDLRGNHIVHDLFNPIWKHIARQIGKIDAVINLASSSDVSEYMEDPTFCTLNNVASTLHLLEWAKTQEIRAFIQVSTNEVYGPATHRDHVEWAPLLPQTPYSASKAAQEALAIGWWNTYEVPIVIINTMHLFGENQPRKRFIPSATRALLQGNPICLFGRESNLGWISQSRQWTYVKDFAEAIYYILGRPVKDSRSKFPDRWNVAGTEHTCRGIALIIAERLGLPLEIEWSTSDRPGHDMRYALDTTAFRKFGFQERYGTAVGLERTIDWIKSREQPR